MLLDETSQIFTFIVGVKLPRRRMTMSAL